MQASRNKCGFGQGHANSERIEQSANIDKCVAVDRHDELVNRPRQIFELRRNSFEKGCS